jgi:bifunctional non-homologous end joining protein LigD
VPPARRVEVEVEGRRLSLSNLDKVMYPEVGFTKGQLIDYYTRVAPVLLPHLRGHPLTLKRYPNGVEGQYFYEKQCPSHRPEWVASAAIPVSRKTIDFCLCDDLPTLVWLANLADLELHPSLSLAAAIERPTVMAFDLDPGPPAGIEECCEVAVLLRDALASLGLESFPKTSGSKGMQVYVPLNRGEATYDDTKPLSQALARHLESQHPKLIVSTQKKELRRGKVLIDWSQNDEHKTTVSVYSLRARPTPTVSTPVRWEELDDPAALSFDSAAVLERVEREGDLFEPVHVLQQTLPEL